MFLSNTHVFRNTTEAKRSTTLISFFAGTFVSLYTSLPYLLLTYSASFSTPSTTPLFPPTQPRAGTHISLIGSYKPHMMEVDRSLLSTRAGIVFVDGENETRREAGELQGYEGPVCQVGTVLPFEGKGRQLWEDHKGDLTVWKSVRHFLSCLLFCVIV